MDDNEKSQYPHGKVFEIWLPAYAEAHCRPSKNMAFLYFDNEVVEDFRDSMMADQLFDI